MKACLVLFGGALRAEAFEPVFGGECAFRLAVARGAAFGGVAKVSLLVRDDFAGEGLLAGALPAGAALEIVRQPVWTVQSLLEGLARAGEGFDVSYFAWADEPFLDPALAGCLEKRRRDYAAEYAYADGWPLGLAPECLAPGVAGVLAKLNAGSPGAPARDTVFAVLQKDINSFDIETEISPVDLRSHRLTLAADSRRNLLLLRRFWDAEGAVPDTAAVEGLVSGKSELLRTLPAFYAVQVSASCPRLCRFCPFPGLRGREGGEKSGFMESGRFEALLDKIAAFSGDAVIDLSLWGELALHPQRLALVRAVLARPALSLVVETCGLGWKDEDLETLAACAAGSAPRENGMAPLSWIVSLDAAAQSGEERENAEAASCAQKLRSLFPAEDVYVQAIRVKGEEEAIEVFYRAWKERGVNVIVQKYDSFCAALPDLRAADLSPVRRQPCWHIMRDVCVLLDGTVPVCREECAAGADSRVLGSVWSEELEVIWQRGEALYLEHAASRYSGLCSRCDEYYTYNF